jgi:hypothetical protein
VAEPLLSGGRHQTWAHPPPHSTNSVGCFTPEIDMWSKIQARSCFSWSAAFRSRLTPHPRASHGGIQRGPRRGSKPQSRGNGKPVGRCRYRPTTNSAGGAYIAVYVCDQGRRLATSHTQGSGQLNHRQNGPILPPGIGAVCRRRQRDAYIRINVCATPPLFEFPATRDHLAGLSPNRPCDLEFGGNDPKERLGRYSATWILSECAVIHPQSAATSLPARAK